MSKFLHILNGDSAIESLKQTGIEGEFLSWIDVLHDGPVPKNLSLEKLSEVRAQFIVECGWGSYDSVLENYQMRDSILRNSTAFNEVVIWNSFELFDQLHLLQLMHWFANNLNSQALKIVSVENYLGKTAKDKWGEWVQKREPVTDEQLDLGKEGWEAFTAETPLELYEISQKDTACFPFLKEALFRLFEEFPDSKNGLSKTESCILKQVQGGTRQVVRLFPKCQAEESVAFMGDFSFWKRINGLLNIPEPLLELEGTIPFYEPLSFPDPEFKKFNVRLTDFGEKVWQKKTDKFSANPLDIWIGGVHLTQENDWRWNLKKRNFEEIT